MATFSYKEGAASARNAPATMRGAKGFRADLPMENNMEQEFTQYPWEATMPDFTGTASAGVMPDRMSIIAVTHHRVVEVAQEHVSRIAPRIPSDRARDAFERGAGMFDIPAPPTDLDDQLG